MDDKFDLKYFKDIISKMVDCLGIHVFHTEKLSRTFLECSCRCVYRSSGLSAEYSLSRSNSWLILSKPSLALDIFLISSSAGKAS